MCANDKFPVALYAHPCSYRITKVSQCPHPHFPRRMTEETFPSTSLCFFSTFLRFHKTFQHMSFAKNTHLLTFHYKIKEYVLLIMREKTTFWGPINNQTIAYCSFSSIQLPSSVQSENWFCTDEGSWMLLKL